MQTILLFASILHVDVHVPISGNIAVRYLLGLEVHDVFMDVFPVKRVDFNEKGDEFVTETKHC